MICKEEQNIKYANEALKVGLEFIGRSKVNYGFYKCPHGHTIELQYSHVRRNNWRCKYCYEDFIKVEAKKSDITILGESNQGVEFRRVRKKCGCEQDMRVAQILKGMKNTQCRTCYSKELSAKCKSQNVSIIDNLDIYTVKIRFNKCGHTKVLQKSQLFRENAVCRECLELSFKDEASIEGLSVIGPSVSGGKDKRQYLLPCGCKKDLRMSHVRESRWQCDIHDNSHMLKQSNIYLLELTAKDGNSWLKLGYARDIPSRVQCYGFDGDCMLLRSVIIDTGRNAIKLEQIIHKKHRKQRISKHVMSAYMANGKTECYPMYMLDTLLNEMEEIDNG